MGVCVSLACTTFTEWITGYAILMMIRITNGNSETDIHGPGRSWHVSASSDYLLVLVIWVPLRSRFAVSVMCYD
ncbi:hypothetical protein EV426DRAFT_617225 [Tirmania nivea]|nr:hypothetical protein EV426DRAFT_617225 [Tirmania nivea]